MKNIWKIEPWEVPSTNRTEAPIEILGIGISYSDGVIAVNSNEDNPVILLISYFDNEGRERSFLRDNISAPIIRKKGIEMELEGEALEAFVAETMDIIVVSAMGGSTKAIRYDAISQVAAMYGQTLLPLEEQTGQIVSLITTGPNE